MWPHWQCWVRAILGGQMQPKGQRAAFWKWSRATLGGRCWLHTQPCSAMLSPAACRRVASTNGPIGKGGGGGGGQVGAVYRSARPTVFWGYLCADQSMEHETTASLGYPQASSAAALRDLFLLGPNLNMKLQLLLGTLDRICPRDLFLLGSNLNMPA